MKLNMGCGFNKLDGYLNVDREASCKPNQIVDFESLPWPWPDNSFDEVLAFHTLEHLGEKSAVYLGIMKELWRVLKPNGLLKIAVPHFRHENYFHDPTHVRMITPIGLAMFDQMRNQQDIDAKGQETKLGIYLEIDFEPLEIYFDLAEPWKSMQERNEISNQDLNDALNKYNNVCYQVRVLMRAVKPGRIVSG